MTTKIVGFQSGHDVSYCVLEDGIPILVEELERISRKKMELGDGLKFFFSRQKDFKNIKHFTFGNFLGRGGRRQRITGDAKSEEKMMKLLSKNNGKFYEFGHHLSHAANVFFTSSFNKSLIVTIDGGGWENSSLRTGLTISEGVNTKIKQLKVVPISEVDLGGMWHDLTRDVFGLSVDYPKGDQAGSVMAMATLGKAKYMKLMPKYRDNIQKLKKIAGGSEQEKFNVAASLQKYTEEVFKKNISKYAANYTNLCLSGGVSLNCVMIGKIKHWFPNIRNIFCDPVPYDAGLALGSARYLWHQVLGKPRVENSALNMSPYLGNKYSKTEVSRALRKFSGRVKIEKADDGKVIGKIYDQKIIAVYGGGSEMGRRALGNRSILADPRNAEMKSIINDKVKHRQWFRPVAPSILEEKVKDWFEDDCKSPYMSFAIKFKKEKRGLVPAVVHFDGTGRLQTVSKKLNPWYHSFIKKWEKKSGVPLIINTSFNDSEPIVDTPEDAIKCFLGTEIDHLYFFDYGMLLSKK